jgi:ribosomal protein S6
METENDIIEPRRYEFSFLVKQEADVAEVTKLLQQHEAEIINDGQVRHMQLAYPIEKETEAFFGYLHVKLAPAHAKQLEKDAGMNKTILRFLLILLPSTPQPAPPRPRGAEERSGAPMGERPAAAMPRPAPDSGTLSNEDLEKKIEEILA